MNTPTPTNLPEKLRDLSEELKGLDWDIPLGSREACLTAADLLDRLKARVPHPSELVGWDDSNVPPECAEGLIQACAVHGVEVPAHIRQATKAKEESDG